MTILMKMLAVIGLALGTSGVQAAENRITVVQQPGDPGSVVSKLSYKEWIQIKNGTKSQKVKMYANLGLQAYDVAVHDARIYLTKNPRDLDGLIVLGTALAMTGRYDLASYYADLLEKHYPGRSVTPNLKGLALLHRPKVGVRDYYAAAKLFEEAIGKSPGEIAAALNLGHLYLDMGNAGSALNAFKVASSRCHDCGVSLLGQGNAYVKLGNFAQAEKTFRELMHVGSHRLEAHYQLALISINGDHDLADARGHLEEILGSDNKAPLDLKRRANVLLRRIDAKLNKLND